MRATIDGVEVYMDDGQLPAFSLSVNNLTDPSVVKGATSTTIRVIATKEARRVLGGEGMAEVPRNGRPVLRIGDDSVDLFVSEMRVLEQNRDQIQCVAVSGNASWFDYAKRTKFTDVITGESPSLTREFIVDTWTDDDSLLYFPLIDYGYLEGRSSSFDVKRWRLRPAMRVHRLLNEALLPTGYQFVAKGKFSDVWEKLVITSPSEPLTPHFYGHPEGATVRSSGSTSYSLTNLGSTPSAYLLDSEQLDPGANYNAGVYEPPFTGDYTVRVDRIGIIINPFSPPTTGEKFYLHVYDFTNNVPLATTMRRFDPAVSDSAVIFHHTFEDVAFPSGVNVGLAIQRESGGYSGSCSIIVTNRVTFHPVDPLFVNKYFKWDSDDITAYQLDGVQMPIQLGSVVPDMNVSNLLQGILDNQGLILVTDNYSKKVSMWHEEEYLRKPATDAPYRDWTTRMDHTQAPAKVYKTAPKRILFRWDDDDGDDELHNITQVTTYPNYGNEDSVIEDGYADEKKIDLPFSQTVMGPMFGGGITAPIMRSKGGDYQVDDYGRTMRLLVADGMATGSWTFDIASETEYPKCYFVTDATNGVPIHWGNATAGYEGTVAHFWDGRVRRLSEPHLEANLFIRDHELKDFDFGMPTLVDDGSGPAWYWVQEIQQHRLGKGIPTKCILVEIPGKEVALKPYVEPEPFVCDGPGYVSITFTGNIDLEYSAGYFSYRRASDGSVHTADGVEAELTGPDTICIWRSHANGTPVEDSRAAFAVYGGDGDITAIEMSGLAAVPFGAYGSLQLLNTSIPEITIPAIAGQEELYIIGSTESIILPSTHALIHIVITCRLTVGSVNAILANLRANEFSGECDLSGGTNAAPTAQGIADVSWLIGNGATIYTN